MHSGVKYLIKIVIYRFFRSRIFRVRSVVAVCDVISRSCFVGKKKADYIAAITAEEVEASAEDDELPPDLDVVDPE